MMKKLHRQDIIRYVIALFCVMIVVLLSLRREEKSVQYDIVLLGDSVVGNTWGEVHVTSVMEERLGKTVFNGAFGGSCMSVHNRQLWGSMSGTEWCMAKLAEAIAYDNWTSQLAVMSYAASYSDVNLQVLDYFEERMHTLAQIDFSQVEILMIQQGTNDYNSGKPVDNPKDMYDVTTFGGALRYSLRIIKEKYPQLRIVLVSPTYCALGANYKQQCYNTSYLEGGILDEYVELEKQIAQEYGVEWIDAYHESGIWEDNMDTYLIDALHPNTEGHVLIGNLIADYLEAGNDKSDKLEANTQ